MKIAVINEGSTKHRNDDVLKALDGLGHEVHNLGMKNAAGEPELTYIETGFLSALLLNLGAVDFVMGGCGNGQGYFNAVMQFPGTACGLLIDPVDAFLWAQVNAGNCLSLSLNKGYSLGGDVNLKYIFKAALDQSYFGKGYPAARVEIQTGTRKQLEKLSLDAHKPMKEILGCMDKEVIRRALGVPGVLEFIKTHAPASDLKDCVLSLAK
ncbi:MAG: RpiB/LacA/LacB family sugar-phosphate isomerase [Spirochaetaceae bacterium]|jgi:ribose 5-phosphate isomerase RpiB|nr:RpiB/LacA/LacB family sugar-phosphate isomerase [Spirochaetaceae bacterium]